jgi:2',3'-cyclic-nucleotide 2'-phosphodiesterase (5'-nucleotidase family)
VGGAARIRLTLLHTNDIHGRVEGLARIATLVERIRGASPHLVVYADGGDSEETTTRLSSLTKGAAMHRLLTAAGCEVAVVGNAGWLRYGPGAVAEQARWARYPLLLANLTPVPGTRPSALIGGVGFVGVTDPFSHMLRDYPIPLESLPVVDVVREQVALLREQGAELVVLLSHMGLDPEVAELTDDALARELQGDVDVVVGSRSHDVLPEGRRIGSVLLVQAGSHAGHLGRVEIDGDERSATVLPVGDDVPPHPRVLAEADRAERMLDEHLDETIADLRRPLDASAVAELLRRRAHADVGLITAANALDYVLPPGPLRRRDLYESCHMSSNPASVELTGSRLRELVDRGRRPEWEAVQPRVFRGRARGRLHVVPDGEFDPARTYLVAATDAELHPFGELVDPAWGLDVRYEFPTILREAIEAELIGGGW